MFFKDKFVTLCQWKYLSVQLFIFLRFHPLTQIKTLREITVSIFTIVSIEQAGASCKAVLDPYTDALI